MSERPRPQNLLEGLTTKADQIRKLAAEGFDRTEIARILGIKYQHVRHVLIRSGVTGGLRRAVSADREPIEIKTSAPRPRPMLGDDLLSCGFRHIGEWRLDHEKHLVLHAEAPSEPGVYAFVFDSVVVYIGVTLNTLRARMHQYRRGHTRQRTSHRIHQRILRELQAGGRIEALVATPEPSEWNGMPVNMSAGLEAGLIEQVQPAWNIRGVN